MNKEIVSVLDEALVVGLYCDINLRRALDNQQARLKEEIRLLGKLISPGYEAKIYYSPG